MVECSRDFINKNPYCFGRNGLIFLRFKRKITKNCILNTFLSNFNFFYLRLEYNRQRFIYLKKTIVCQKLHFFFVIFYSSQKKNFFCYCFISFISRVFLRERSPKKMSQLPGHNGDTNDRLVILNIYT